MLRSTTEVLIHRALEDAEAAARKAWVDWRRSDMAYVCVCVVM